MTNTKGIVLALLLILSGLSYSFAQDGSSVVDTSNINYELIRQLFLERLNQLRAEHHLTKLGADTTLARAATDQADYMKTTGVVGHMQKNKEKASPTDRVTYYHGTNDRVGENCCEIPMFSSYKEKDNTEVNTSTYAGVADALFEGWKNSPPHYRNMITPYYDMQGIGFSYDSKTKELYSSDVFGTVAFIPPKGFIIRSDAWGVKAGAATLDFFSKDLANFVVRSGDSIFLYYSNLDFFKQYVNSPKDGIAIDIVAHEQFNCNHNNNLHGSRVFDGMMLEPVYYNDLMRRNRYGPKSNELYTFLGLIPKQLLNRDIQLNTILIKNKYSSGYSYPLTLDCKNLQMLHLTTFWDTIKGRPKADTFKVKLNHYIEFNRSVSKLTRQQIKKLIERMSQYKDFIDSIEIETFSSVEGSEEGNIKLQEERANNIKAALAPLTHKAISVQVQAKENWDDFYNQIKDTRYEYLNKYSKEVIKLMLRNPILLDSLDAFLSQERTAVVRFSMSGKFTSDMDTTVTRIALQHAIQHDDSASAWLIQSKMIDYYVKGKMSLDDIVDNDVPVKPEFLPVLANIMAAKAVNVNYLYDPKFRRFAKEVFAIGGNSAQLKLSYCVCAINYLGATNDTLVNNSLVEKYLDDCSKDPSLSSIIWRYYLDFYIVSAYYYWDRHQYGSMDNSLEGIKTYYPKTVLADTDYIKLGRLFNMYYRQRWTYEMLYPLIKNGTKNEDLLFLFVTTAPMFLDLLPQDEYILYLQEARRINPDRFCAWITQQNWQLLREDFIKKLYCEQCNTP